MSVSGFSHVTIVCADLDASIEFYRDALAMEVRDRPLPDGFPRAAIAHFEGGAWSVHLFQAKGEGGVAAGRPTRRTTGPFLHVSFRATDHAGLCARLARRGVTVREFTADDRHLVQFLDPDGVEIELTFSPSEVRRRPED